mgnify:CR=1 FL=1
MIVAFVPVLLVIVISSVAVEVPRFVVVVIDDVDAAVIRPCASTVMTGIAVADP